jgi:dolichyl-phosphate beta-glucosyltransferase
MLDECLAYLDKRSKQNVDFTYEVIVVDDGSTDNTSQVAFEYSKDYPVRVLKLAKNVGKGGAVRCGVLCSGGSLILFADADGATKFSDFGKLETNFLEQSPNRLKLTDKAIIIGSRCV